MDRQFPVALSLLLIAMTLVSATVFADLQDDFNGAYSRYQEQLEAGNHEQALVSAQRAYELGRELFGKRNVNTANLGINLGKLMNQVDSSWIEPNKEAANVLLSSLHILEKEYGKQSPRLVDALIELGKANLDPSRPRRTLQPFRRAARLLEDHDPMLRARVNLEMGMFLAKHQFYPDPYLTTAHEIYLEQVGEMDVRTALAASYRGNLATAEEDYEKARELLQSAVNAFAASNVGSRVFELNARVFLIRALEELGKSDLATEHCRAIGRKKPLAPDEQYLPIYKVQPEYPRSALRQRRSGEVVVEFTVDQDGFTQDHRVVRATSNDFAEAAVAAAQQFRYAPRFENGKPVATKGVRNKLIFEVRD